MTEVELNHKGSTSDDEPPKKLVKYDNQDEINTSQNKPSITPNIIEVSIFIYKID